MKKILLTAVAALGVFVACEKDDIAALNDDFGQIIARVDGDIADNTGLISDLRGDFDAFVIAINEKIDLAVAALEAADEALEDLINSEIAGLRAEFNEKLDKAILALNASIDENTDLIKSTGAELRLKLEAEKAARIAGDLELETELAEQVAKLDSVDARQLGLIHGNLRSISAANARISAENAARVAADAELQTGINSNTLAISGLASRTVELEGSVGVLQTELDAAEEAIVAQGLVDTNHGNRISGLRTELNAAVSAANELSVRVAATEAFEVTIGTLQADLAALAGNTHTSSETVSAIQTAINSLRSGLETFATNGDTEVKNAINRQIGTINGLINGLRTDLTAVQGYSSQIDALGTRIAALEGVDNATQAELNAAIDALRSELQAYADANGPADDDSALQTAIDALSTRIDNLPTGGSGGSGGGSAINWEPYNNSLVDYVQNGLLEGATVTRPVTVTPGSPSDVLGGESITITFDGFGTIEEAQAAHTTPGTYQIVRATRTVVADGVRSIVYTAVANGVTIGTHTVTSTISGSDNTVNENVPYTVAADPADTLSDWVYGSTGPQSDSAWGSADFAGSQADGATIEFTRTRTVDVNGDEDSTPPAGDLSETKTFNNSGYTAPVQDPTDLGWQNSGSTTGGEDTNIRANGNPSSTFSIEGVVRGTTLAAAQAWANENLAAGTTWDIRERTVQPQIKDVTAVLQPQTWVVSGTADADAPAVRTRNSEVTGARTAVAHDELVTTDTHSHTTPAATTPEAPSVSGDITVNFNNAGFGLFTAAGGEYTIRDSSGTVVVATTSNPSSTFSFDAAETYTITVSNNITSATAGTVDIVVDASDDAGAYNVAIVGGVVTITRG